MNNPHYVVTIIVLAYGRTTRLDIDIDTANAFDNTRLYQLSRALDYTPARCVIDTHTRAYVNKIFRSDFSGKTTLQVIQDYINYSTPAYLEIYKENGVYVDDNIGQLYDPITFDKTVHTLGSIQAANSIFGKIMDDFIYRPMFGVFLVSVHEKTTQSGVDKMQLLFPTDEVSSRDFEINLLDLGSVAKLARYLPDLSSNIRDTLSRIRSDYQPFIPEKTGSHEKPIVFNNNPHNMRYLIDDKIEIVRLSYIANMVKSIFGRDTKTNIMDYSCSVLPEDFPEKEKIFQQYIKPAYSYNTNMPDLEMGSNQRFGGRRRQTVKKLKTMARKKNGKKYISRLKRTGRMRNQTRTRKKTSTTRRLFAQPRKTRKSMRRRRMPGPIRNIAKKIHRNRGGRIEPIRNNLSNYQLAIDSENTDTNGIYENHD